MAGVVHFGARWPTIPEAVIEDLKLELGGSDFAVEAMEMEEGSVVTVAGGVFDGLRGLLVRVLPARERVRVLLDFLGRKLEVELSPESLVSDFRGFRFCVSDAAGVPVGHGASPGAIPV